MSTTAQSLPLTKNEKSKFRTHTIDLLVQLVTRDMLVRYKGSTLGFLWSLMLPILQMVVFTFLFHRVLAMGVSNYGAFVSVGVLSWNWFSTSIMSAVGAITENRDLVRKPGVPIATLPIARVIVDMIHFLLALPILIIYLMLTHISITPLILLVPVLMGIQLTLVSGLSYIAAALNVPFRDTAHLLSVVLMLAFYVTPIFWDGKMAPHQYQVFLTFNPMAQLVQAYRQTLIYHTMPNFMALGIIFATSILLLVIGRWLFNSMSSRFVDEL